MISKPDAICRIPNLLIRVEVLSSETQTMLAKLVWRSASRPQRQPRRTRVSLQPALYLNQTGTTPDALRSLESHVTGPPRKRPAAQSGPLHGNSREALAICSKPPTQLGSPEEQHNFIERRLWA
jgi:hypothetical protein